MFASYSAVIHISRIHSTLNQSDPSLADIRFNGPDLQDDNSIQTMNLCLLVLLITATCVPSNQMSVTVYLSAQLQGLMISLLYPASQCQEKDGIN